MSIPQVGTGGCSGKGVEPDLSPSIFSAHTDRSGAHRAAHPAKKQGTRLLASPPELRVVNKVAAAILLPASLIALGAKRLFFSVADGLDAAGVDTGRNQGTLY
jgi:hypothetical protein